MTGAGTLRELLYLLSGRHCGTFVQDALRAGGIDPFAKMSRITEVCSRPSRR